MVSGIEKTTLQSFWINIGKLLSGSALSQAIVFLTIPVITRFYSPDDFGIAAMFAVIVFSLEPISSLSYHQAIMLCEKDTDALNICALSFFIVTIFSLLLFIPFGLFNREIASFFNAPLLEHFTWLIPIVVFSRAVYLILSFENSRRKNFSLQAFSTVVQTVTDKVIIIGAGFMGHATASAMIISRVIASFFETGVFASDIRALIKNRGVISIPAIKKLAYKHRAFPLFANWVALLSDGSARLPIYMLAFFFSPEITGLYAMADRLIRTPMSLLGNSIRRVYYQAAANEKNNGVDLKVFFESIRLRLLGYSLFPFLALMIMGEEIFTIILGSKWENVGTYIGILGILAVAQFVSIPIASLVNVLGKQKSFLWLTLWLFLLKFFSLIAGGFIQDPIISVWFLVIAGILFYIYINFWIGGIIGIEKRETLMFFTKYIFLNMPFIGVLFLSRMFIPNLFYQAIIFIITSTSYYLLVIYLIERVFLFTEFRAVFSRFFGRR
ncbi:MAG: oligosaccharide flippase family protein [Proteobacteria bacterium]|nr:oligosaccharide flippase family protein [Pseudomonadota bacterium]MBU1388553.1 oligosaccharide flippase family protein [Pseudomonadota bacterium]MBU1544850.1 oligosaccharide flippase family protein [Pseudomonadota bacterium]MBU2482302.1 oligosaccharide flippase family protein [Pseudomonadota bacterium]